MRPGCRKGCMKVTILFFCRVYVFVAGMFTTKKEVDFDYSYYLGPNYKEQEDKQKRTSTLVSNHVSFLDGPIIVKHLYPGFSPSAEFKHVSVISAIANAVNSIWIPRGGTEEKRTAALQAIQDR